jgi:hypothetical protein
MRTTLPRPTSFTGCTVRLPLLYCIVIETFVVGPFPLAGLVFSADVDRACGYSG